MRTGVVLGAGGYVGQAYHLGVLCALGERVGFDARKAEVLVGTSAGSLVAAGLAGGLSAGDLAAELLGEPLSPDGHRVRKAAHAQAQAAQVLRDTAPTVSGWGPLSPLAVLGAARHPLRTRPAAVVSALLPAGRTETDPIARGIRHLHGNDWPERDLRICAVRAGTAQRTVFGTPGAPRTDVGTAVAASCAIPSYFMPVRVGRHLYVDGGVHSPTNADVLLRDELDLVVVLSPMSVVRTTASADLPLRLVVRRYLAGEVRRLRRRGTRVVVVQPTAKDLAVMGINPMQGHRIEDVVQTAAASVRRRLDAQPDLVELLSGS